MRETGQVTFTFLNNTGGTVIVPFHVHMKASLCGGPFKSDHLRKMFVPFHKQLAAAHNLSSWHSNQVQHAFKDYHERTVDGLDDSLEPMLDDSMYMPL